MMVPSLLRGIFAKSNSSKRADLGHLRGATRRDGGGKGATPADVDEASLRLQHVMK